MTDIVEELKGFAHCCGASEAGNGAFRVVSLTGSGSEETEQNLRAVLREAAALIASQARRIEELEEGLEPFDEAFGFMLDGTDDYQSEEPVTLTCGRNTTHFLVLGHFRRARSLLSRKGGE